MSEKRRLLFKPVDCIVGSGGPGRTRIEKGLEVSPTTLPLTNFPPNKPLTAIKKPEVTQEPEIP